MDQRAFATALGTTHATYGHWELGTNTPRDLVAVARRVEALTKIPAAWLLGVTPPPGSNVNFGWSKRPFNGPNAKVKVQAARVAA
jgi:transcriptional regulator with XRE-family HTH domain